MNGVQDAHLSSYIFIPHVRRISCLMDLRFTSHSPVRICISSLALMGSHNIIYWFQAANANKGHYLTLTCQSINNLQDLYGFFSTLGAIWPPHNFDTAEKEVTNCLAEIEQVLANDFLEKMPSNISAR